jgi:holo-[acyl-carrier protein] synthase
VNELPALTDDDRQAPGQVMGVGIDLTSIPELRSTVEQFGQAYLRRIFTSAELSYCLATADPMAQLAAAWAAKEAAIKACGLAGMEAPWHSIEVGRHADHVCRIRLDGAAADLAGERGINHLAVSVSHEGDTATAIVVATGRK